MCFMEKPRREKRPDFLSLAMSRRTTYDFDETPLREDDITRILEAGRWAPSFLNSQPWEFVVFTAPEKVEALMNAAYYGAYSHEKHPSTPPLAVALVLKKKCWEGQYSFPRKDKPGIYEAYLSIAMPAMSMALEAEDRGIASCILNVDQAQASRVMNLAPGDIVPLIVCFGYGKKGAKERKRERKPLREIVRRGH